MFIVVDALSHNFYPKNINHFFNFSEDKASFCVIYSFLGGPRIIEKAI